MSAVTFSSAEVATLRTHGIVLFAGRIIFDAQPPMPAREIAQVREACAGPLPPGLLALWRETAGGRLDYSLTVSMAAHQEAVSWTELFYNGSDGYRDLQGWMDHEVELMEEAADRPVRRWRTPKLTYLPFGGFEYCDRVYVAVEPGPHYGQVLAWKQGLPGWTGRLPEDSMGPVASSVEEAFAGLNLEADPLAPVEDYWTGQDLFAYLDGRQEAGLAVELRTKLVDHYRGAVLDWATPLAAGRLAADPALARVALRHAIATDDGELVARLAAAGVELNGPLQGSSAALELAVGRGKSGAALAFARAGALVPPDVLDQVDRAIPGELTAALLRAGATPTAGAVVRTVACGAPDSARLIAAAGLQVDRNLAAAYEAERATLLAELESHLAQVNDPAQNYGHYLGAAGLAERIARLRGFRLDDSPGAR